MGIKIGDFQKRYLQKMNKALKEVTGKKLLTEAKDGVVSEIVTRVRLGFGVDKSGARKQKLKKLDSSYVRQRKKSDLGKGASASKSNLHKTGQMVEEDIGGIVDGNKIIIGMETDRSAKVAAFVSKQRPFLNMSRGEIQRLTKFFKVEITEIFRKLIKNLD